MYIYIYIYIYTISSITGGAHPEPHPCDDRRAAISTRQRRAHWRLDGLIYLSI